MTPFLGCLTVHQRVGTPWVGGAMFHTPSQRDFRNKQLGYYADSVSGAHAPVRHARKHPTGAASAYTMEPDGDLYLSVMGDWGRPVRAGRP